MLCMTSICAWFYIRPHRFQDIAAFIGKSQSLDTFAGFQNSGTGMKKDGIIFCHDIIVDGSEAVSENIENLDVTLTSPSSTRCQAENVTFFRSYCRQSMNYSVTRLQLTDLH